MADTILGEDHRLGAILQSGSRWEASCVCGWTSRCGFYNDCLDDFETHITTSLSRF